MRRLRRGFTLLEVLVSMSILVVPGTSLMLILRGGLQTWRRSEAKRESFDRAQAILLQLRDDFANLSAPLGEDVFDHLRRAVGGGVLERPSAERDVVPLESEEVAAGR